jgi:hypothetical protein
MTGGFGLQIIVSEWFCTAAIGVIVGAIMFFIGRSSAVPTNVVPTNVVPNIAVPKNVVPTNVVPNIAVPKNVVPRMWSRTNCRTIMTQSQVTYNLKSLRFVPLAEGHQGCWIENCAQYS